VAAHCLVLQSKQFRNPAVKIGRVICFHVNKVNMDNKVLKFRAVRAPHRFIAPSSACGPAEQLNWLNGTIFFCGESESV
jgi:hypothetical protein